MQPHKSRHAPPRAGAMIEALRGLGYSTSTAIADIIDNSIYVKANNININFIWKGSNSIVTIQDDGEGMSDIELDHAMRLGLKSPLDFRESNDLGRFGLGLKTASLAQCKRLTVASKKDNKTNCLRWDLDVISNTADDGWYLLEGPDDASTGLIAPLEKSTSGTLVLWENLDRIVVPGFSEQNFLDMVDNVERHLAMVFHRFLDEINPKLRISINGRPVAPWDPFMSNHPTTWKSPVVTLTTKGETIEVQCFVLPHKDKMDQREYEIAAGPDGWTSQQGFYVYRNKRLLVAGSWLGLGHGRSWTKEEAHRLARIRLDIPNTVDADWKIDIRKSIAKPPVSLRPTLTRLAEDTRSRARRVFVHRGQSVRIGDNQPVVQAWRAEHFNGGMRYRIDLEHPAVSAVLDEAGALAPQLKAMLRVLEETIPVQRIWLDTTECKETPLTGFVGNVPHEVKEVLEVMFNNLVFRKGMSPELAREKLLHTEPFQNYPDLVCTLHHETSKREQ